MRQEARANSSGSRNRAGAPGEGADAATAGEEEGRRAVERRATTPSSWTTRRPEPS